MVQGNAMSFLALALLAAGAHSLQTGNATGHGRRMHCACREGVSESACLPLTDNQKPRFYDPFGGSQKGGGSCCKIFSSYAWNWYEKLKYVKHGKEYVAAKPEKCDWDVRSATGRCCRTSDGSGFEVSKVKRQYTDGHWSAPFFDKGDITLAQDSESNVLELDAAMKRLSNNNVGRLCKEDMKKIEDAPCELAEPIEVKVCCCHKYDEKTTRADTHCLEVDNAPGEAQVAKKYRDSQLRTSSYPWKEWVWNDKSFQKGTWDHHEVIEQSLIEPADPPSIDESGKGMASSLTRPDPDLDSNEDLKEREFVWDLAKEQWERTCVTYRGIDSAVMGNEYEETYIPDSCSETKKDKGWAGHCPHLRRKYTTYSTTTEQKCERFMWKRRCTAGHALYNRRPAEATPGSCGQSSMGNDKCPPNYVVKKGESECTCEPECK